jgi:hypothetical protein
MRLDLSNVFVLDEAFTRGAARADFDSSTEDIDKWAVGTCTRTIMLKRCSGNKLYDLVGTTYSGFYLLSRRAVSMLEREKVIGWRACSVRFKDEQDALIDGYSAIGIIGRCGYLDNTRSQKVTRLSPEADSSITSWIGMYFDEETWDGSDLFRPRGTMLTLATARAKELLEQMLVTNVRFRRVLEVERLAL